MIDCVCLQRVIFACVTLRVTFACGFCMLILHVGLHVIFACVSLRVVILRVIYACDFACYLRAITCVIACEINCMWYRVRFREVACELCTYGLRVISHVIASCHMLACV